MHHSLAAAASLLMVGILIAVFAVGAFPDVTPGVVPGYAPDSQDYAYGAEALLRGTYIVDWDGVPHVPRYTPGYSALLVPAVALGGVGAAVLVPYAFALISAAAAAFLAWRLAGPLAAPVAAFAVLYAPWAAMLSIRVMSEVPTTGLLLLEAAALVLGRRLRTIGAAGALAGFLVWVRPAAAVLLLAGLAPSPDRASWRRRAVTYLAGAAPFLLALALWQWRTFGTPFTTSYQAAGASADGTTELGSFFSLGYIVGLPVNTWDSPTPNLPAYMGWLFGTQVWVTFPGVGILGLCGWLLEARSTGRRASFARFGLAALAFTLAIYLPYFWQNSRFMLAPAALLGIGAAVAGVDFTRWLCTRVSAYLSMRQERALASLETKGRIRCTSRTVTSAWRQLSHSGCCGEGACNPPARRVGLSS